MAEKNIEIIPFKDVHIGDTVYILQSSKWRVHPRGIVLAIKPNYYIVRIAGPCFTHYDVKRKTVFRLKEVSPR